MQRTENWVEHVIETFPGYPETFQFFCGGGGVLSGSDIYITMSLKNKSDAESAEIKLSTNSPLLKTKLDKIISGDNDLSNAIPEPPPAPQSSRIVCKYNFDLTKEEEKEKFLHCISAIDLVSPIDEKIIFKISKKVTNSGYELERKSKEKSKQTFLPILTFIHGMNEFFVNSDNIPKEIIHFISNLFVQNIAEFDRLHARLKAPTLSKGEEVTNNFISSKIKPLINIYRGEINKENDSLLSWFKGDTFIKDCQQKIKVLEDALSILTDPHNVDDQTIKDFMNIKFDINDNMNINDKTLAMIVDRVQGRIKLMADERIYTISKDM